MKSMPKISPSFDKEASRPSYGKTGMKSSLLADSPSHSYPSVTEISLVNTASKEVSSFEDSFKNVNFQSGGLRSSLGTHRREVSTSSTELEDVWNEKQRDDPVGELITKMLNKGRVPHFGYPYSFVELSTALDVDEGLQLSPLFSARNYRAMRKFILAKCNHDNSLSSVSPGERGGMEHGLSMRFFLETFAVCYIVIYYMNDVALRSLSEFILFTVFGSVFRILFDIEEVKHTSSSLASFLTPSFFIDFIERCNAAGKETFGVIEKEILWGDPFQGRTFLWSDNERLVKFRRKHRRLMATNNERKHNKRERMRSRAERRRREKRGERFSPMEMEKMEQEINAHEQLEAAARQLALKPPSFFPEKVHVVVSSDLSSRTDTTEQHLDSLQYCHQMIFIGKREQDAVKTVEIRAMSDEKRMSTRSHRSSYSPREAIEVVDQFPDIGPDFDLKRHAHPEESDSFTFSDVSYSVSYDEGSDYSSDEDDGTSSLGSYESESTAHSMPWMVVGAKIGHKLLTARKLRRVIANPESAQSLIPDEAKKLIDGINIDRINIDGINKDMSLESHPSKASSWDGPATSDDISPTAGLPHSKSNEMEMKPPVHGMWTSAGSAARTPNSYGAVTMEASPPRGQYSEENLSRSMSPKNAHRGNIPPSRWSLGGARAPPPSPQIELQLNSTLLASQRVGDTLGYKPPSPLIKNMPTSSPNKILQSTVTTPQQSNSSRNTFSFCDTKEPPAPVTRLAPIEKGVKMVVPIFPPNTETNASITSGSCFYQMGTVMSSRRVHIPPNKNTKSKRKRKTNCLSINVILDNALLRGSKFARMILRIMDEWNYIPRHSKFPIGSCVATTFGAGVLVGWRVEDDMHIIRSLWNRSGPGSGLAYLRRDSVHSVLEAAVGFDVQTTYGSGKVVAYVRGGRKNTNGKYFVHLTGRRKGRVIEFNRCQILTCQGAKFVPVTEHIRAAALYRLEVLHYKAKVREQMLNSPAKAVRNKGMWRNFSEYVDLFANSFSKAIAEDPDFDKEVDKFVCHIINLLDGKECNDGKLLSIGSEPANVNMGLCPASPSQESDNKHVAETTVGWNINEMFSCFFVDTKEEKRQDNGDALLQAQAFEEAHESAEILFRVLLRTITVARASVPDRPKLHIALAMIHESLLFVRQIFRVQKMYTSRKLIEAWFRALSEISNTFGPLKQRMTALGVQIAKKFRKHGNIAKRRILRFVDITLGDTQLLHALELGDWKKSLSRLEVAIVKANITDAATCEQLHKGALMMYKNLAPRKKDRKSKAAAARNGQKMVNFAKMIKILASPGRSIMRLLTFDEVLSLFDRVLVRVFDKDPLCSTMINIYAFNFDTIRHLRTLNNMSIAGKLWETVLDAIDEELTFATSEIPEQTKYFIDPVVKLFSLGVSQFHCIQSGGSTADWLDFLMEDEAVKIIQDLEMKFIDSLEALCNDIKQVVQVLPYIKTIDNDILNLMDEFDLDLFLKEITDVIGDSEKSVAYITERSSILVERFLDYLPRMSIPIERRELQDGWVLTCRGKDGGDLRLSDISVLRENLVLSVLGSKNVFHPSSCGSGYIGSPKNIFPESVGSDLTDDHDKEGESILDEIKDLILSAQTHGAWIAGIGGLKKPYNFKGVPCQLADLPMSDKLKSQIDLWKTSAISDFKLLETAIREVSYQIQLQNEREENGIESPQQSHSNVSPFNPRLDPTVLFIDIKNLTLRLEEFGFRVEKGEPLTIFDPVFEGCGSIVVKNVSIMLKVEVKKERVFRGGLETPRPVLQLAKFEVELEKLKLEFTETGADWILNAVLKGFSNQITEIVQDNLKEQIVKQFHIVLEQVNGFIDSNPDLLMNAIGITMKDLEESIVCV